jgi:hypothetical protein
MSRLHATLVAQGHPFEILAFPCNQYGGQEPGTNEVLRCCVNTKANPLIICQEIRALAVSHDVKFIMCNKVDVQGPRFPAKTQPAHYFCILIPLFQAAPCICIRMLKAAWLDGLAISQVELYQVPVRRRGESRQPLRPYHRTC